MKNYFFIVIIALSVSFPATAQEEIIRPLTYNPIQEADMKKRAERIRQNPDQWQRLNSMELPFIDDFSTDKFPGNEDGEPVHWQNNLVFLNSTYGILPPSVGVVTFDGGDEFGYPYDLSASNNPGVPCDTLTSVPINLDYPASDSIYFSFYFQGQGRGELPESSDSLVLQFYAPNLDQWFYAWSEPGRSMDEFEKVVIPVTQDRYLHDNFQFRFVNYATPRGALDHWHVDYIQLDRNRQLEETLTDVAFVYIPHTLLTPYTRMPWSHYIENPQEYMVDQITTTVYNNDTLSRTILDRILEVTFDGAVQGVYQNPSEPPIDSLELATLIEPVGGGNFGFQFDPGVDEDCAVFDVEFSNVVSPDFIQKNNRVSFQQEFYSYYAYDDGSAERGYGTDLAGSSAALRYVNMKGDSLIGLMIWFEAINAIPGENSFFPFVWSDSGNGPGDVIVQGLWEDVTFGEEQQPGWRLFEFLEPVFIEEGSFYVGVTQSLNTMLNIGLDYNTSFNDGNLYYYQSTVGYWLESSAPGTIMMRPVFKSPKIGPLSVENNVLASAQIFPNPARDVLNIETGRGDFTGSVQILNMTGQMVQQQSIQSAAQLSIADLPTGIYMLRLQPTDGSTQRVFKFVKQ